MDGRMEGWMDRQTEEERMALCLLCPAGVISLPEYFVHASSPLQAD